MIPGSVSPKSNFQALLEDGHPPKNIEQTTFCLGCPQSLEGKCCLEQGKLTSTAQIPLRYVVLKDQKNKTLV